MEGTLSHPKLDIDSKAGYSGLMECPATKLLSTLKMHSSGPATMDENALPPMTKNSWGDTPDVEALLKQSHKQAIYYNQIRQQVETARAELLQTRKELQQSQKTHNDCLKDVETLKGWVKKAWHEAQQKADNDILSMQPIQHA